MRYAVRALDVAKALRIYVHWKHSKMNDLSEPTSYGHQPFCVGFDFPVRSDNWGRRQLPAMFEVVIHEGLHQHLIDVRARGRPCDRGQVLHERSEKPVTLDSEY